ncbi:hypothetical protein KJY77_00710 [Canibacter sp. lx-72]|uniref:hypothetical protein n=1 Tax=Canibacter zhuwentaonis TaxID=2837491 RepID=UPI001BDC79BD|nr:hypothetical protein [Canibacter zhuwentaonis]MBT1017668.1 hypothetical protein [Canibacter zhuwentaonis]
MINAPLLLVLDEPFQGSYSVSAASVTELLEKFVGGGSVVMLSHSLELIERTCDHVVVIAGGIIIERAPLTACAAAGASSKNSCI